MTKDKWHDDRQDLELSTKCFAARVKSIRKDLGTTSWITAAAAYVASVDVVRSRIAAWGTDRFWDLKLPEETEEKICRWIALGIIVSDLRHFGLKFREAPALTYDQITGLLLTKDLSVERIAHVTGVSSRRILELNPKIMVAGGKLPAKTKGRRVSHRLAAPKGKGWRLVEYLKKNGYLAKAAKRK